MGHGTNCMHQLHHVHLVQRVPRRPKLNEEAPAAGDENFNPSCSDYTAMVACQYPVWAASLCWRCTEPTAR